jgi:DNA-binding FadR family transcriptional regulator
METLKIQNHGVTLVDQVEDKLLMYIKDNHLQIGDAIPNESELTNALGVARSVLREALSRMKMMGVIESRTRRGMILCEPSLLDGMKRVINPSILSESSLLDMLGFRITLEIGMCGDLFAKITDRDIEELDNIVKVSTAFENNEYTPVSEYSFHAKLYEITGNKTIIQFQEIIRPIMTFVKDKFKNFLEPINIEMSKQHKIITHSDLLHYLQKNDKNGFHQAIEQHFEVYRIFMRNREITNIN